MFTKNYSMVATLIILVLLCFSIGCGRSSVNNELIGQVKKVQNHTPILCPNYDSADVSLGVMQNGVGSMSTQDVWVTVPAEQLAQFKSAVESGIPVKVNYDVWRWAPCTEDSWATNIAPLRSTVPSPLASPSATSTPVPVPPRVIANG